MYNYETIKLPHEAAPALKITSVGADASTLSGSNSLTTVKASAGETVVPSTVNTPLAVRNGLTTTSFSEGVRLATPSFSVSTPVSCASIASGIPLTSVSFSATDSQPVDASVIPSGHLSDGSIPSTLAVATMSEAESTSVHAREDPVKIGQIVHTTEDGVLEENLVSSSSIDAVVTSMVASSDCQGLVSNGRKIPSQVIAKLLSDDSLSLDMVRIITDQDLEGTGHQSQGFNVLARPSMLVQTKLADNDVMNRSSLNQYRQVEVLNLRPSLRPDSKEPTHCSVVWTCAYCSMAFPSSEAVRQHQEKECTENQEIAIATTTTTPTVVETMMSPLRQVNDQPYDMKLGKESQNVKEHNLHHIDYKDEELLDSDYESVLGCAVCGCEFLHLDELNKHHLTHTIQELSSALLKLTKPHRRKKVAKVHPPSLPTSSPPSTVLRKQDESENPGGGGGGGNVWNKTDVSLVKDKIADNPGDTPPQSPLEEDVAEKVKAKQSPKVTSRKNEKRRADKKVSKETKVPRQRKCKGRVVGQGSRDPHTCHICNKVLSCRGNLSKHLITHRSDKPFKCTTCGLGFNAKRDQQYHYLQHHTNKRPYNCVVCGKGYVFRHYLLKHMAYHGEERKFACDICGKHFITPKCVLRHKKRHRKERLFKCYSCLKSFTVNADLRAHIRKIHLNSKKTGHAKQQLDFQPKVSQSLQALQHKNQPGDVQPIKSKDITEFLLPAQLLPTNLESTALSGAEQSKEGVFITADPIGSIIPLSDLSTTEYNASVTPIGDHTTYVMINSTEEEVPSQNVSASQGLNIMYTAAAAPPQQVNDKSFFQVLQL